jgi:hypothetical protein
LIPVVGELYLGGVIGRPAVEENQGEAATFVLLPSKLAQPELVDEKVDGKVEIANA